MADGSAGGRQRAAQRVSILLELACWLALAAIAFGLSFQFADEPGTYRWGAASWPRAVILLMVVTAIIHAMSRLRDDQAEVAADQPSDGRDLAGSLGLFLIPLVYAWLLPRTGFYLTTPMFLIALLLHVGERRWSVLLATTAIITALVFLVFTRLFYVALPTGTWPLVYEANTWLLTVIR